MIVEALSAIRNESTQVGSIDRFAGRCDNDNHPAALQRYEGLAAERVSFDDVESQWQRCRRSTSRDTYRDIPALVYLDLAKIVEALKARSVHRRRFVGSRLYDVAIASKTLRS